MKYFLTLFMMAFFAMSVHAQWWFDGGIKGDYGPTLMFDHNVFDHGSYKHKITTGTAIGGRLGFNYGYHVGLSVEYASAVSRQDFNFHSEVYNKFKWKHNDWAGLIRYSGNGAYIEIGGEYSKIKSVELKNVDVASIQDVTADFSKNYKSGVFGFGSYLLGGGLVTVNLGIRLHFAVDDMVSTTGKANGFPIVYEALKHPEKKTLATAAQLHLEANVAFGRFAKSACHDRWRLLLFQ
ncbi:MAG: hypothetical protein ABJC12_13965 [Saprospiraceae bacterium]